MKQKDTPSAVLQRIYETRRDNLRLLAEGAGGAAGVGGKIGYSGQYMSQLIGMNPIRVINEKAARTIEAKLKLANGWLDVAR